MGNNFTIKNQIFLIITISFLIAMFDGPADLFEVLIHTVFITGALSIYFFNIARIFKPKSIDSGFGNVIDLVIIPLVLIGLLITPYDKWDVTLTQVNPPSIPFHSPLSYEQWEAILLFGILSIIGYLLLRFRRNKLSPIIKTLCLICVYIGFVFSVIWVIQLFANYDLITQWHYSLFYILLDITSASGDTYIVFNMFIVPYYIICIIVLIVDMVRERAGESKHNYRSKILIFCDRMIFKSKSIPLVALILLLPFYGVCVVILMLLGEQADAPVKIFTETSDWFFSKKISPPYIPAPPFDHYLCTVAAQGHGSIVKPTRQGVRRGHIIVVNRQLCVANAFEELISDSSPRLHRIIRNVYDRYGYPLSRHIKKPVAADVVYILMKPLEWFFVVILYTFDVKPEQRIARQYSEKA